MVLAAWAQVAQPQTVSPFLVAMFGALLGALVGGGGITLMVRLALTERLRATFADKDNVISKADLQMLKTELTALKGDLGVFVRTEVQSVIGSAENRIAREYERLRKDLDRAVGAMEFVAEQSRADGRLAQAAMGEAQLAKQQAESLQKLFDEFVRRFSHMENTLERIERAEMVRVDLQASRDRTG